MFFQNGINRQYQESARSTFYGGNVAEWDITTVDYTDGATFSGATTAAGFHATVGTTGLTKGDAYNGACGGYFVFYFDTTIPLCMLNQMFDNKEGANIIPKIVRGAGEAFRIEIRCLPVSVAKLWGDETMFSATYTGVCDAHIDLFTISMAAVSSNSTNGSWASSTWKV